MSDLRDKQRHSESLRAALDTASYHEQLAELARRRNEIVHAYDSSGMQLMDLAAEAHAAGLSVTEISQALSVSRPTVYAWIERAGERAPNPVPPAHVRGGPRSEHFTGSRFEIFPTSAGSFRWRLVAANNTVLTTSEEYTHAQAARDAVEQVRRSAGAAEVYELISGARRERRAANRRAVLAAERGGWDVRRPEGVRASSHHRTKTEAIQAARRQLKSAGGGELIIHGNDGRVQRSETVAPAVASA